MEQFFRVLVSAFSMLILFLGMLHRLRVRSARWFALRTLKSVAEALSPGIAAAGAVIAILAAGLRSPLAFAAAATGSMLSLRYIWRITRYQPSFQAAFGPQWQDRLSANLTSAHQAAMLASNWTWVMPAARHAPELETNVVYHTVAPGEGVEPVELRCDIWRPPQETAPTGVAMIYVHGGGYFTSQKDFGTRPFFRHLASQGHTIMDIDYRLGPQANVFDMLSDVFHALKWLKTNAQRLVIDPQRIVLAGGSAGAHLALLAAYARDNPELVPPELLGTDLSIRAAISYYGILDMEATYRSIEAFYAGSAPNKSMPGEVINHPLTMWANGLAAWFRGVDPEAMHSYLIENNDLIRAGLSESMHALVGGAPEEIPDVYRMISPLYHAGPHCPPTLLIQGEHDFLLPEAAFEEMYDRLSASEVPVVAVKLPATEHTFDLFLPRYSPPAQAALYHLERFLVLML
jgi:acetyl esterase/lipase